MKFITSATLISLLFTLQNAYAMGGGSGGKTTAVPEPSTWALMGIGLVALLARHFWKNR